MGTVVHNGIHHQSHFYHICFSNIWENQGNFNSKWLSLSLKQKLFDKFQQKWRSDMNNSSKGLCYTIFKDCFEFENYLNLLDDKDRLTR
jgi:hypothetical protein